MQPAPEEKSVKRNYIESVTRGEGKFELILNGEELFGSGAQDLSVKLTKDGKEGSSVLTGLSLSGIPMGEGTFAFNAAFDHKTKVKKTWTSPARYGHA